MTDAEKETLEQWLEEHGLPDDVLDDAIREVLAENRGHLANNENLADACKQYERRAVQAEAEVERLRAELSKTCTEKVEAHLEIERLRTALDTIGGGHTNRFPGAPDVMAGTPAEFQSGMWTWSQKVAREALKGEAK